MITNKEFLTLPRAALEAKLSSEQMRRRILRGEIAAEVVAGRYLVEVESLRAYIVRHSGEPVPTA